MPDWTYQTVFRPVLLRLPADLALRVALGSLGTLARCPGGRKIIQWMGHMAPDRRLRRQYGPLNLRSPVGLGTALDTQLRATAAFAEFGFGCLELGPVTLGPQPVAGFVAGPVTWDLHKEQQTSRAPYARQTLADVERVLRRLRPDDPPVWVRIAPATAEDMLTIVDFLGEQGAVGVIPWASWAALEARLLARPAEQRPAVLLAVPSSPTPDARTMAICRQAMDQGLAAGLVIDGPMDHEPATPSVAEDSITRGACCLAAGLRATAALRAGLGDDVFLAGGPGIHTPGDALTYWRQGANFVQVDTGLVFSGPGLAKRINEAFLYEAWHGTLPAWQQPCFRLSPPATSADEDTPPPFGAQPGVWGMFLGVSMLLGGMLAMVVANTRVVLPYDEAMAGLTRHQLSQINDHLLSFMTHDRVTVAGTMLAVGILYVSLSWFGIRQGVHWAQKSVVASAFVGFASFFAFLGFGYFDPFHAFVTAILFQFLLFMIHTRLPLRETMPATNLSNDRRWYWGQWGQLLFVIHGAILIVAGAVISGIAMTSVFVPEDLEFMRTTADALYGAHPHLVPLVAHDRAAFGGMLLACGVATLLPGLWGFQRGNGWLWWALMTGGNVAYAATIWVHWHVGYHSPKHLLPAYGGMLLLWAGGLLSYGHLTSRQR